ncbi:universal stress protein [Haladaptatus sp. DFWS20]|uniref:universal stress protein n=1 Tax=Haladaptatus sp. DFWS20 TaxID=3403467 RepID=UPI003EB76F1F
MKILVPIDGSESSMGAVRFAAGFARRYDATLEVVHFRNERSDTAEKILTMAREVLSDEGADADCRIELDPDLQFRPGNRVGKRILRLVAENEYDHVIMGHHGTGAVDEAIIGSATRRVSKAGSVSLTIIP